MEPAALHDVTARGVKDTTCYAQRRHRSCYIRKRLHFRQRKPHSGTVGRPWGVIPPGTVCIEPVTPNGLMTNIISYAKPTSYLIKKKQVLLNLMGKCCTIRVQM